ncbi:MAG: DNA primase [Verrucomicrobia bacterium]|nr:MAG: DNA primase [Verrucomicrobiota bacterium]
MAGIISPATLEQIRSASDIVDVIGSYLPLKKAGLNFATLCPFHKEKTPSFNVNPHRQIFHCFGCHKGGDVFTFVQEYESISFVEAVRRLADRAHIPLEFDRQPGQQQARHLKETLLEIHEQIAQRWHTALLHDAAGQIARDYLRKRGVSDDALKLFGLGYALDLWEDTVNWARGKGHELPTVEQAGLIIRRESGDGYYDRFRGRLIFPICDEQGRVIGFSGRVLAGDEKTAKYVNSPETPIFTKGKVFFGLDKSKRAILDAGFAIICEGQLDLIACYMADVKNVVAPQGTAFTADHARILKRYVDEVVLCFDSDIAGQAAAVRVLDSLLASGLAIRVATVPAPHDPDSFIKEFGGPAFQELIGKAEGFFDYYLKRLCQINDVASDKGRVAVVKDLGVAVQKTRNQVLIDTYAQKAALRLGVSPDALRAEFKKLSRSKTETPAAGNEAAESADTPARPSPLEFWLLKLLLTDDEHVGWVASRFKLEWVQHPMVRRIVERRLQAHAQGQWQGVAALLSEMDEPAAKSLVTEAAAEPNAIKNADEVLKGNAQKKGLIAILRDKFIDQQLASLTARMVAPDSGDAERLDLLRQQQELRQLKRQALN